MERLHLEAVLLYRLEAARARVHPQVLEAPVIIQAGQAEAM